MAAALQVIVDDNDMSIFRYGGGDWTTSTLVQWYRQTSNYPAFAVTLDPNKSFGTLFMTFEGTAVAFIGNTPQNALSQVATVSIDGGTPYNISYANPPPPAYIQWYKTPTLAPGRHNVSITHLDGTAVDYALIDVAPDTNLTSKRVAVDDASAAVQYTGSWRRNTNQFNAGSLPDGFPFGNGTHRTETVGDTATFKFSGTSLEVYGVFSWMSVGTLAATFTVDGVPSAQTWTVTSESPRLVAGDGEAINFPFFTTDSLSAGDHTLVINVTRCDGIGFWLDYFTYVPSFATLADMPPSSGGGGSTAAGSATTTSGTSSTGTQGALGDPGSKASESKGPPIGAIVGCVIGGLVVVAAFGGFLLWLRKRRSTGKGESLDNVPDVREVESPVPPSVSTMPSPATADRLVPLRNPLSPSPFTANLATDSQPASSPRDVKGGASFNYGPPSPDMHTTVSQERSLSPDLGHSSHITSMYEASEPSERSPPAYDTLSNANRLSSRP